MTAFCGQCKKTSLKVAKVKGGKCPACGGFNTMIKVPKPRKQ
jgi:DNA-directed RNA polymerase subunit RPC12/RpoP